MKHSDKPSENGFSYDRLKGHVVASGYNLATFAKAFGISSTAMYAKFNGNTPWSQNDILKAVTLLNIKEPEEAWQCFFSK